MKKLFLLFFLASMIWETDVCGQSGISNDSLYQLALGDLHLFAQRLTADRKTELDKAIAVVNWFADNFNWTYTDYQQRSIQDILERKGGNCNELARVSKACLEHLKIPTRRVREVNLHVPSPDRQERARQKVKEIGNRASVFGYRHNDHVWLELYDSTPAPGQTGRTVHHRIIPEEINIIGREAYDWGYYEGRTRREDGSELPWRGKYVITWKKNALGDWQIYLDIWNRVAD